MGRERAMNARALSGLLLGLAVAGCAVAAKIDARQEYQASAANYKSCLASNPSQNCESLRLAMEVDERKYNNLSAGANPDGSRSGTLTVINR